MKKTYNIEIDCANCANLVEEAINKMDYINSSTVNFMMQKLIIDFEESQDEKKLIKSILKEGRKIDPEFEIEF